MSCPQVEIDQTAHSASAVTVPRSAGKELILIVEDSADDLRLIQAILHRYGYRTLAAPNLQKARELVARVGSIDLVLLDFELPDGEGLVFCREIRLLEHYDDVPVIFLTGRTAAQDKLDAFNAGGADYITKPMSPMELAARLNLHLELSRSRRDLRAKTELLQQVVVDQGQRLDQVRTGQVDLLTDPSEIEGLCAAFRYQPALDAGGDFCDLVRLAEKEYGVLVADIAGHDVSIAYLTGALKALTASFINEGLSVRESAIMFNGALLRLLGAERYVSMCYARHSRESMTVEIVNAGHPGPILVRPSGEVRVFEMVGDVLGIFDRIQCDIEMVEVSRGDRLYLYSDGLIEQFPDGEGSLLSRPAGTGRLAERLRAKWEQPLQKVVDSVVDELLDLNNGVLEDDVVLLGTEF